MREWSRGWLGAVVLGLTLVLVACSGDSSDGEALQVAGESAPGEQSAQSGETETAGDTDEPGESSGGGDLSLVPEGDTDLLGNPAGQGLVELSGARYDFILNSACQKFFGAVQAAGPLADGSDGSVDVVIPPEDWETDTEAGWDPPYVQIENGDESWLAELGTEHFVEGANIELTAEQSAVTSFTNDGSRVAGEAVFFKRFNFETLETATGSFEFYCP